MSGAQFWQTVQQWADVEWRHTDVDGYQASEFGDIRSLDRTIVDRNGRTMRLKGRTLRPNVNPQNGYQYVLLGRRNSRYVHDLVLIAFKGPAPDKYTASHLNGKRLDNKATNLVWESQKDNCARQIEHGTRIRGEARHNAKLTSTAVADIRTTFVGVRGQIASFARKYGVDESTVREVICMETWK